MTHRWGTLLNEARTRYRSGGRTALIRGAHRYTRQRLPIELWPPLALDPVCEADDSVRLFETRQFNLEYHGQFRESLPRQLAAAEGRILGAPGELYVFEDAAIVGRRPVVRVDGRYFPASWLGVDTAFFIHQEKYLKRNLPLTTAFQHSVSNSPCGHDVDLGFLLLGERSHEFPAWHHEVLPKLRWLEKYEEMTGKSPTLIVSADLGSFHERSLQLMGYDPDDWIDPADGGIRARKLLVPPHPRRSKGTHLHTTALDWVADRILTNVDVSATDFSDRIYVSRQDADRRNVRNEQAVKRALNEVGFECYEPGRLSYEDEVRLFAGAAHIVGAHGKGLASIFYADDATLVELFPRGGATEHYFLTAKECGFEYEFLSCDPGDGNGNTRARDRDFSVDVSALGARLASVGALDSLDEFEE